MTGQEIIRAAVAAGALSLMMSGVALKAGKRLRLVAGGRRVPALGGLGVLLAWWSVAYALRLLSPDALAGLSAATLVILLVGLRDARRPLGPWPQLAFQALAALFVVFVGGIAVTFVTNPLGGIMRLDQFVVGGVALPGTALTVLWIVTLMNATNFLDGMDGLAASVSAVAFIAVGLVSMLPQVNDPRTAVLAFAAAAALIGFLFWNLPPAALYLGTVGSWFVGFLLAVLAAQGASKVATTAVVGAVPLLDALAVIVGRLRRGQSPLRGDRTHLHHRLERRGISPRAILLLYLTASVVLGLGAVVLQTRFKLLVFGVVSILFAFLIVVGSFVVRRTRNSPVDGHASAP